MLLIVNQESLFDIMFEILHCEPTKFTQMMTTHLTRHDAANFTELSDIGLLSM